MAIDFACADCGRKLRVADGYAGRRVTCPKCGSRVRVHSALRAEHAVAAATTNGDGGGSNSAGYDSAFESVLSAPVMAEAAGTLSGVNGPTVNSPAFNGSFVDLEPAPPAGEDLLTEVWYLRVAEVDSVFGPLTREELDAWVDQGRVVPTCQLCNADMSWRSACDIYPDLSAAALPFAMPRLARDSGLPEFDFSVPTDASAHRPDAVEQISATMPGATLEQLEQMDSVVVPPHFPTSHVGAPLDARSTTRPDQRHDAAEFSWGGEVHWRQPVSNSAPRVMEAPRATTETPPPFLQGLLDSSFKHRVTPQVVRVVYGAALAGAVLVGVASIAVAVMAVALVIRSGQGFERLFLLIPGLISVAAGLFLGVLVVRLLCEAVLHLLRIAEACDRPKR